MKGVQSIELHVPQDMLDKVDLPPMKRLPKEWHELLEECFELTVIIRNYQTVVRNMTSEASKSMSAIEAGRVFVYSFYTWVFYQDAVIEHTKTVISLASKIYGAPKGTANQLKKRYHKEANALKKDTEEKRNAVVHGGGFISRALTEDQWWDRNVAIGILPGYLLDEFVYAERGRRLHLGHYDEIMSMGPQGFLDEITNLLHNFEQEIVAPS
ncbi:MAG: hypothetical protein J4F46_04490 [Dehalococcoidia bacterium]|nr:hypothetical protein [Dehalococcoidia bacterium]